MSFSSFGVVGFAMRSAAGGARELGEARIDQRDLERRARGRVVLAHGADVFRHPLERAPDLLRYLFRPAPERHLGGELSISVARARRYPAASTVTAKTEPPLPLVPPTTLAKWRRVRE